MVNPTYGIEMVSSQAVSLDQDWQAVGAALGQLGVHAVDALAFSYTWTAILRYLAVIAAMYVIPFLPCLAVCVVDHVGACLDMVFPGVIFLCFPLFSSIGKQRLYMCSSFRISFTWSFHAQKRIAEGFNWMQLCDSFSIFSPICTC